MDEAARMDTEEALRRRLTVFETFLRGNPSAEELMALADVYAARAAADTTRRAVEWLRSDGAARVSAGASSTGYVARRLADVLPDALGAQPPADTERRDSAGDRDGSRAGAREAVELRALQRPDQPDLLSRMIDARDCLRPLGGAVAQAPDTAERAIAAGLRWLEAGIEEGRQQREMMRALRILLDGEPHVCTCGHTSDEARDGCSDAFEDRCRFERSLRTLVGIGS